MDALRWDIFCTVIDNFGDIGVCWRLARQLANEQGAHVRLWVDDLARYHQLLGADPSAAAHDRVEVCHWGGRLAPDARADIVVASFGCRLPEAYLAGMAARTPRPVWVNLDYLSAESWVEGCHRLPSPHPTLPLTEYFFFPGFTPQTGGLLREAGLIEMRDGFRAASDAQATSWRALQTVAPPADALRVSLFSYENPAVVDLLEAWASGGRAVWCGVPEGRVWQSLLPWLGGVVAPGQVLRRGNLWLAPLAFVDQPGYDRLLWSCDLNFVRGEDSFVRAQWAGRPLVWHIYPQAEDAHLVKLDAFLDRYIAGLPDDAAEAVRGLHHAWNAGSGVAPAWRAFDAARPALLAHADAWCRRLAAQSDLATALAQFVKSKLK